MGMEFETLPLSFAHKFLVFPFSSTSLLQPPSLFLEARYPFLYFPAYTFTIVKLAHTKILLCNVCIAVMNEP